MRARVWAAWMCECGNVLWNCDRPDQDKTMCVNRDCKHFEKKFSIPTVELQEAPSEWEALMTR